MSPQTITRCYLSATAVRNCAGDGQGAGDRAFLRLMKETLANANVLAADRAALLAEHCVDGAGLPSRPRACRLDYREGRSATSGL